MINTKPLVSVLMTVYNREEYIKQAIESILASTYTNFELIIVDDRSTDKSFEIAKKYQEKDNRIKLHINEINLGDYPNRNQAAAYAKGKYLKYVDADDMIYPYGLEILVYYMEQFPEVAYGLCSIDQDLKNIYPLQLSAKETYQRHYLDGLSVFHKAPLSSIILRSVFEKEGGFSNVRHFGDSDFWHRLSQKYSVVLMPQGIVWYRKTDGQEASVRRKNPMNRLKTIFSNYEHTVSKDSPLDAKDQSRLEKHFLNQIASAVIFGFRKFGWKKGEEMRRFSGMTYIEIIKNKVF